MAMKPKNVILITIDCLRADHVSCYGYSRNTTPNLDELANKGILFKQAIVNGVSHSGILPGYTCLHLPTIAQRWTGDCNEKQHLDCRDTQQQWLSNSSLPLQSLVVKDIWLCQGI